MGGKNSTPPPPPDYRAAAIETANSNQQQNTAQTWANRPNMVTPFGTSTWTSGKTIDPSTGLPVTNWTNNVSLTPDQQHALDQQNSLQSSRSDAAAGLLGRAQGAFGQPLDTSGLTGFYNGANPAQLNTSGGPAGPAFNPISAGTSTGAATANGISSVGLQRGIDNNGANIQTGMSAPGSYNDAATNAIMQRLQPMQDRQQAALQTQMANQGIAPGSEAYSNAMRDFGTQTNDARLGAIGQGFQQGNQEYQQALSGGQFKNSALNQQFNQGAEQGKYANDASNSTFNQGAQSAQVQNQAAGIQNQNSQFNVQTGLNEQNQNNQLMQMHHQNAVDQYSRQNQAQMQQQDAGQNYGSYESQLRGQQMQEAMMRRNMPLNEMNAFLSGQQVQNPTFNGPNSTANRAAGTDFSGAAQNQNSADMARYQMQMGAQNSQTAALGSLAGTAASAFMF